MRKPYAISDSVIACVLAVLTNAIVCESEHPVAMGASERLKPLYTLATPCKR